MIPDEKKTIRINEKLALARSLGDKDIGNGVSGRPKITSIPLSDISPGSYLVVVCDGITDVASTNQIGALIQRETNAHQDLASIAQNLAFLAYEAKSRDNLSVVIIKIT